MGVKILNVNITEKEIRQLIEFRWSEVAEKAESSCVNDEPEEIIEHLSEARGLLNSIQYFAEALQDNEPEEADNE